LQVTEEKDRERGWRGEVSMGRGTNWGYVSDGIEHGGSSVQKGMVCIKPVLGVMDQSRKEEGKRHDKNTACCGKE